MDWTPAVHAASSLVLAGAAVGGTLVAWFGLESWRREARWRTGYELARRIVIALLRYRDAIETVRNPVLLPFEMAPMEDEPQARDPLSGSPSQGGSPWRPSSANAYRRRWQRLEDARRALDAEIVEGQAVWGLDFSQHFACLYRLQDELWRAVQLTIRIEQGLDEPHRSRFQQRLDQLRPVLERGFPDETEREGSGEGHDRFGDDLETQVKLIEEKLRAKLER